MTLKSVDNQFYHCFRSPPRKKKLGEILDYSNVPELNDDLFDNVPGEDDYDFVNEMLADDVSTSVQGRGVAVKSVDQC